MKGDSVRLKEEKGGAFKSGNRKDVGGTSFLSFLAVVVGWCSSLKIGSGVNVYAALAVLTAPLSEETSSWQ